MSNPSTIRPIGRLQTAMLGLAISVSLLSAGPARAEDSVIQAASTISAISTLPVAVAVEAGALVLTGGAMLTVSAVQASAHGTVWVLERAGDGARASVRFGSKVVQGASIGVGTVVVVTAISTGYLISSASQMLAFVPNQRGAALLYSERVTK